MNSNNKSTSPITTIEANCTSISNSPFVDDSGSDNKNNNNSPSLFLGVVNKRYVKTFHGIVHGIGSMLALILGNYVFTERVLLGRNTSVVDYTHYSSTNTNDRSLLQTVEIIFHVCNFGASVITAVFFWNKVQSWQLSTTTLKEKGLTPTILQKFNQGRGVVCMILFSAFPLVCSFCCRLPEYYYRHLFLENKIFSMVLALALITGSAQVYNLIKDYSKLLWVVYGMTPMALGVSILLCSSSSSGDYAYGTVASLNQRYPAALDRIQKEASFVISCVQMGFMLYYLYSRKLVTQRTVQRICKTYHVTMSMTFLFRVERDLWLQFSTTNTTTTSDDRSIATVVLPWPMLIQPLILTLAMSAKLLPAILKKVLAGAKAATTTQSNIFKKETTKKVFLLQTVSAFNSNSTEPPPSTSSTSSSTERRIQSAPSALASTTTTTTRRRSVSIRVESIVCQ